jgi:magnesium-protoporphyrin O-methyltransferase
MSPRVPHRFCCDEELASIGYDGRDAAKDLTALRARGPRSTTTELIDVVRANGVEGSVVLDVGAGVGAVHLALLEAGALRAIDVDASREYLAAAREEATHLGLHERVAHHYGDIVELAPELPSADVVTLDSVICCYPYLAPLIRAATRSRPRLVGLTYPRDTWWMRVYTQLWNLTHAIRGGRERGFIHSHARLNRLMADGGYRTIHEGGSRAWRVVVYRRANGSEQREVGEASAGG